MIIIHKKQYLIDQFLVRLWILATTTKWSKGCSFEGTQFYFIGTRPFMYIVLAQSIFKEEMILSLDYQTIFSALWNWPWVIVRFLMVVNWFSLSGQKQNSLENGGRQEFKSPPKMMSQSGRCFLSSVSPTLSFSICNLFLSALELRWEEMRMQLSTQRKALVSELFRFSLCSLVSPLKISQMSFFFSNDASFAMIIVSLAPSTAMMCSLRLIRQLQKKSEYSWKKKMSHWSLAKLSTIFLTFRYSFRKLNSQKGRMAFRQTSGSFVNACSIVSTLNTYFSNV